MPFILDKKTKKKIQLDPMTGQPVVEQGSTEPQEGGGMIERIVRALASPAVKAIKTIGTGAEEAIQTGQYMFGDKQAFNKPVIDSDFKLSDEEKQNVREHPVQEAIKTSAGLASYIFPGGKVAEGAGFIPKLIQGIKAGAGAGGLYNLSQSKSNDLEGMAVDAGTGAVTGGITGGVLSAAGQAAEKVFGGGGKSIASKGDAMRQGVVKPQVKASPFMAEEEKAIAQTLQQEGARGSANAQKEQLPTIFRNITKKIEDRLKVVTTKPRISQVQTIIKDALDNNVNYDETIPSMVRAKDKYMNQIVAGLKQGKGLTGLFKVKQNLAGQLDNAFSKLERGVPLTDREEVALTMWKSIDDIITLKDPQIKNLTTTQSYLYRASPGIQKQANKSLTVPVFGYIGTGGERLYQSSKDALGRGMKSMGGAMSSTTNRVSDFMTGKLPMTNSSPTDIASKTTAFLTSPNAFPQQQNMSQPTTEPQGNNGASTVSPDGQWQTLPDGKTYSMDGQWMFDEASDDWVPNPNPGMGTGGDQANPQAPMSLSQYNSQLSALARRNDTAAVRQYDLIAKERDYYYPPEKQKPLSGTSSVLFEKANTAVKAVDQIEQSLFGKDGKFNGGKLWAKRLNPLNQEGRRLGKDIVSAIDILGYFRTGAAINEDQRNDYIYMFPNEFDDEETVKKKLADLKTEFEAYSKRIGMSGGADNLQQFMFPQQ